MIDLVITDTCKTRGSRQDFVCFDERVKHFADIEDARAYLADTFGKCKRTSIYLDTKSKGTLRVGTCFHFNDMENVVQSWVSFYDGKFRLPVSPKTGASYYTVEEARALRSKYGPEN